VPDSEGRFRFYDEFIWLISVNCAQTIFFIDSEPL